MLFFHSESAHTWETIAEIGTTLVIVGVIGELPEIGVKLIKSLESRWRWFKSWIAKPSRVKTCFNWCEKHELEIDIVATVAWVLVVVGLAVELGGSHEAKKIEDAENALLHKEAGQAIKDAALANDRAANVEKTNAWIWQTNLQLELKTQGRTVQFNGEAFGKALLGRPGTGFGYGKTLGLQAVKLELLYPPNDAEAYGLASMISFRATQHEWEVLPIRPFTDRDILEMRGGRSFSGDAPQAAKAWPLPWGSPSPFALIVNSYPPDPLEKTPDKSKSPITVFKWALSQSGLGVVGDSDVYRDSSVATNLIKVVIMPKM
jgi:hypothetical protein